jgi:hypothetical protein
MLPTMIALDGRTLTIDALTAIAGGARVGLAPDARVAVEAARAVVDRAAAGDVAVYGVNTGFGSFAQTRIDKADLDALQMNLVRSHAAGVGEPLPVRTVRAAMALRANVLARGHSGIRPETLDALLALLNAGVHPYVPSRGSVGASGDLAPLAHIALALVGEGDVWDGRSRIPAGGALAAAGLVPVRPAAKEGLALVNGTQASTAVLALAVAAAARLARAADVVAALTIMPASTPPGLTSANGCRPTTCAAWSRAARSTTPTPTAGGCRTPIRCAACPRCTARPATSSATPPASSRSKPTPPPTTRWSSPRTAPCCRAATSTARRWRWPPTPWPSPWCSWRRSANGAPNGW